MPSGFGCCPPACLPPAGDGPVRSRLALLWYLLSLLFCGWAWQCLTLELFFFPPLSGYLSRSLGCYLVLAPSDCPQGVQAQSVLTLSSAACASLFSPCLLVVNVSVWATSLLGVAVRPIICVCVCVCVSSWLCCPLRFQNPTDPPVRGFPGVC